MAPSKALLAKIHIAKKELALDDESYRDLLHVQFGVDSAAKLTDQQAAGLLDIFRQRGWKLKTSQKQPGTARRDGRYIEIKEGPSAAQQRKVLAMWNALGYGMDKLHARCQRQFGVDRFEWLTEPRQLHILITDLQARMDAKPRERRN